MCDQLKKSILFIKTERKTCEQDLLICKKNMISKISCQISVDIN